MARFGLLAFLLLAACGSIAPNDSATQKRSAAAARAEAARLRRACGSQEGYDRLKALAFTDVARIRRAESPALKRLASLSVVRMDRPVAVSRDDALGVTVCRGRLVLELPQGAEDVFDGDRRLEAEIEYSAQDAADGSGPVYQMKGAEPIIYRLAAVDLRARGPAPSAMPAEAVPPPGPSVAVAPVASPVPTPRTAPKPKPKPKPVATRAATPTEPRPTPTRAATPPKPAKVAARPAPRPTPAKVAPRPVSRPAPVGAAARPSFRCDDARSRVERLVCEDPRLARADRAMSAEFRAAMAYADPYARRELLRTRDEFLAYRDRCPSAGCVIDAYADRIEEIRDIAADR